MALVNVVFRVHCREFERGWGSRPWHSDFETLAEAEAFKNKINGQNTLDYVPDEYDIAERIETVVVDENT